MVSDKHQFKMIFWTVIVIAGLFVCLGSSMLEPPHLYRHRIAVAQARLNESAQVADNETATGIVPVVHSVSRLPASIGNRLTSIQDSAAGKRASDERQHRIGGDDFFPALAIETYDIVLPCLNAKIPKAAILEGSRAVVPKTVKQVRIRASQCEKNAGFGEMQITNQSNGFSATIFKPSTDTWLTDYISLTKDSSVIRLAFANQKGDSQTRDFVIERAQSAQ